MAIAKTYILINGNKLGFGIDLNSGIRKQITFSGTSPHNQRSCGTFYTEDKSVQLALENSPMYGKIYEVYMSSEIFEKKKCKEKNLSDEAPTPVKVDGVTSWSEAKVYMVENCGLPKNTSNATEVLRQSAVDLGLDFGI